MHTGYRSKSRWFKDDKNAVSQLERTFNLADAKLQLHLATHKDKSDPRDIYRNLSIVIRGGKLKP